MVVPEDPTLEQLAEAIETMAEIIQGMVVVLENLTTNMDRVIEHLRILNELARSK